MSDLKKKKARWFGLLVAAFGVMCTFGTVHMWLLPVCITVMTACLVKGQLWEWGGIK